MQWLLDVAKRASAVECEGIVLGPDTEVTDAWEFKEPRQAADYGDQEPLR